MERINLPSPQFSSQALQLSFLKAVVQRPAGQSRNGICPINSPNKEFVSYEIKADTVLLSYNNFSHHITNNSLLLHFPGRSLVLSLLHHITFFFLVYRLLGC